MNLKLGDFIEYGKSSSMAFRLVTIWNKPRDNFWEKKKRNNTPDQFIFKANVYKIQRHHFVCNVCWANKREGPDRPTNINCFLSGDRPIYSFSRQLSFQRNRKRQAICGCNVSKPVTGPIVPMKWNRPKSNFGMVHQQVKSIHQTAQSYSQMPAQSHLNPTFQQLLPPAKNAWPTSILICSYLTPWLCQGACSPMTSMKKSALIMPRNAQNIVRDMLKAVWQS